MLAMQSVTAAYAGQVRQARELTKRAMRTGQGPRPPGSGRHVRGGRRLVGSGLRQLPGGGASRHSKPWRCRGAASPELERAEPSRSAATPIRAEQLADEMVRRFPQDSFFKASWLPMVHAAVSLHRGNPAAAVEQLKRAERVELGTNAAVWPAYLRGLAYLKQGAYAEARLEFQKILDNKGVLVPKDFNPSAITLYPLAYLGRRPRSRPASAAWTRADRRTRRCLGSGRTLTRTSPSCGLPDASTGSWESRPPRAASPRRSRERRRLDGQSSANDNVVRDVKRINPA